MNNNLGTGIQEMVAQSSQEPAKRHNQLYRDALNQKYGKPFDQGAYEDASIIWHNNQGEDDWYNKNMRFLLNQYNSRIAKPDFDPIKFGKIIENQIDSRLTTPNEFSKWYNKKTLNSTDRRYLAADIYDSLIDLKDYYDRYPEDFK